MRRKKVLESWTRRVGPAEWDTEVGGMEVKALSPTAERQTDRDRSVPGFRRQESSSALEKLHGSLAG